MANDDARKNFAHESLHDAETIATYLEELIAGFRSGRIELASEESEVELSPHGLIRMEVRVKERRDASRLSLSFRWRRRDADPGFGPLRITAGDK